MPEANTIADNTVILSLELGKVSNRRKLESDTEAIETDVDRDSLYVSVELFKAKELRDCQSFLYKLTKKVRKKSVPSFMRNGLFLVKLEAVDQVDSILNEGVEKFRPLVTAFASVVDKRRDERRKALGPAFDVALFPTAEDVKKRYRIHWQWLSMSTPSSLKRISKGFFEREQAKAEKSMQDAAAKINSLLASEAKALIDHMIERLTPDPDGKIKVFHSSMVSNITEFLQGFEMRNIGGSDGLAEKVKQIEKLMDGVTPNALKGSDALKESVTAGFKKIADGLDKFVIDQPVRAMSLKKR